MLTSAARCGGTSVLRRIELLLHESDMRRPVGSPHAKPFGKVN